MRIPRDIDANHLVNLLGRYGYEVTRQTGSHIRLTSKICGEEHHVTIPNHNPLRIGTLSSILNDVAKFLNVGKDKIVNELFS
ncbi:MAG: type II toxin-antitoxin system HicA family toxin [Syntrophomonadaceae bacterium]|nr:type II toxin-antitoxin system HicA family toxin [Syntrophomonadaceae bacterium]